MGEVVLLAWLGLFIGWGWCLVSDVFKEDGG